MVERITPDPGGLQRAAILAALERLRNGDGHGYRSAWRVAAFSEAAGADDDESPQVERPRSTRGATRA